MDYRGKKGIKSDGNNVWHEGNFDPDKKADKTQILTNVPANAKFTDTVTTVNGKTGVISKADIVALGIPSQDTVYVHPTGTNPHNTTKGDVGLASVDNIQQATKAEFNSHNNDSTRHITGAERNTWNSKANVSQIPTKTSQLTNDSTYVTQSDLGSAGLGDMLKSVYDKNNNGKVDVAESADTAKYLIGDDTRSVNSPPSEYMSAGSRYADKVGWQTEFKSVSTMGLSSFMGGSYCYVETKNPWSDPSGGYPIQIAYGGDAVMCMRIGVSNTAWGAWNKTTTQTYHVGSSDISDKDVFWIDTTK